MPTPDGQLVYDENFENILRPHRAALTPKCIDRLKSEAGVDVSTKLRPNYPRPAFDKTLLILAQEIYPTKSLEKATLQLGEDIIAPFQGSVLGKAILGVIKLIPIKSSLRRLPGYLKSGNNYIEATVVETGEFSYDLTLNEMGAYPQYWVGVMSAGNRILGYAQSSVTLVAYDGHKGTLRIKLK